MATMDEEGKMSDYLVEDEVLQAQKEEAVDSEATEEVVEESRDCDESAYCEQEEQKGSNTSYISRCRSVSEIIDEDLRISEQAYNVSVAVVTLLLILFFSTVTSFLIDLTRGITSEF